MLNEESFAWKTAEAVARGAAVGRAAPVSDRRKGQVAGRRVDAATHDDGELRVDLRELERLVVEEGVTAVPRVRRRRRYWGVEPPCRCRELESLGFAAEVHGVVAVRYCHDTTGRAFTAKVRTRSPRSLCGSDRRTVARRARGTTRASSTRTEASCCAARSRGDATGPTACRRIWAEAHAKLEAAVAKGEDGGGVRALERLASTRLGQHWRAGARGERAPVNTFFDITRTRTARSSFCIPDNAEVLAVLYSKQDESRAQFLRQAARVRGPRLAQMERMVEGVVRVEVVVRASARLKPRDLTRACARAQAAELVKLTVATKASGRGRR